MWFECLTCCLDACLSSHLVAFSFYVFFPLKNLFFASSIVSRQIPLLLRFLGLTLTASRKIGRSIEPKSCALYLLDTSSTDSLSIKIFGFHLDRSSTASWSVMTLLHALFFTIFFASFYYLVIHNILFHYIHAFIWIPFAPLIIFMFLGWSFIASCTLCQSWQKGEENVVFFFRFYMLRKEIHAFVRGSCVSSC